MSLENIIHSEFLIDPDIQYLNHAAVSPWPVRTANAVKQFADENVHTGATRYLAWLEVETKVDLTDSQVVELRKRIRKIASFKKKGKKIDDYFAISEGGK